jgi:hypothetical protein
MSDTSKGLILDILRGKHDCTMNGITGQARGLDSVTLVGTIESRGNSVRPMPEDSRVFGPSDDRPAVALASNLAGTAYLCPVEWTGHGYVRTARGMAGGHYATTGDSRGSRLVAEFIGAERFYGALSVHDRFEG